MWAVRRSAARRIVPAMASRLTINSSDSQSGMKLCPAPVTRSLVAPRTSAASSSSLCGRATCPFAVTLPDQLLHAICLAPASGLKAFAGEKVSQDYILSADGQRTTKHDLPDINDNIPAPKTIAKQHTLAHWPLPPPTKH